VACPSTKTDLAIFERKVLRRIFDSKKNEETNEYERRTNDDLPSTQPLVEMKS